MAGMGGALKNMSIGIASIKGKLNIHSVGKTLDQNECWNNLSVDCDCDSNPADPKMKDIWIFASLDPVSVDQACYDAVINSKDPGKDALIECLNSKHAIHVVEAAHRHCLGNTDYELINID